MQQELKSTLFVNENGSVERSCDHPSSIRYGRNLPAPHIHGEQLTPSESLAAGVVSGIATRTACAPLTTIKTLFQLQKTKISADSSEYRGIIHALQEITRNTGLRSLWKGCLTGCCRLAPYAGVKFAVFDQLKTVFGEENSCGELVLTTPERLAFGGLAGVAATLSTYPLDLVQTQQIAYNNSHRVHRSAWGIMTEICLREGPRGLFRGGYTSIVGVIPYEGVQFAVYETLKAKELFGGGRPRNEGSMSGCFLAGSVAGAAGQTISYPLDVVRTRLAAPGAHEYKGMLDCFSKIFSEEGIHGLFRGNVASLVSVIPRAAIMFCSYELLKRQLSR